MNLVTGAGGHIGNVLVRSLCAHNIPVRALLLPGEDPKPLAGLPIEIVEGDILDVSSLMQASYRVDTIYHLAGMISIMPGRNDLLRSVNILGTRNVLYAARQSKVRKLVYTSSIHAFRRVPHGVVIDEMIPFDPQHALSEYDRSKALASLEVQQAARDGLNTVIACPTGVIGPFDFHRSEMGQIILDCLQRKPQIIIEGIYDFVDVRDVAYGLIAAAQYGKTGETYILSGEKLSVRSLLDNIRALSGMQFLRFHLPNYLVRFFARFAPAYYRLTHIRPRLTPYALETLSSNANISHAKAKAVLNYNPRPLVESLHDAIQWFRENRTLFGLQA